MAFIDPKDMSIWPEEIPTTLHTNYLIWTKGGGFQITTFSDNNGKSKKPYFYWCGSPKKVWWSKLVTPTM